MNYLTGNEMTPDQREHIEDLLEEFYAGADYDALPDEERKAIEKKREDERAEADKQKTAEIHSDVDKAIAGGWWPTVEEGVLKLGRNLPPELDKYASPESHRKIKERIAQHLMGQANP